MDYDAGLQAVHDLIDWLGRSPAKDRNEATTRFHLIDQLFINCFGWDRNDCVAEEHHDGTFTDYTFSLRERLLIVEAKKEGIYFELPAGTRKIIYPLRFFKKSEPLDAAIRQAMRYCQERGTRFGAVCNGTQLIAFIATRTDGLPPLEGDALVFESLDHLADEFLLAWNCLSRSGVASYGLQVKLHDTQLAPIPEKPAAFISGYPAFRRRNSLQTDLQILADLFLEDIAGFGTVRNEKDFLRTCYARAGHSRSTRQ